MWKHQLAREKRVSFARHCLVLLKAFSHHLVASLEPFHQFVKLDFLCSDDVYLHWGELVLVVLGKRRGCTIFKQRIVIEQDANIIEDLEI